MKLVVADPRKIDITEFAALHLRQKPGTDVALVNGLMHIILKNGWQDQAFIDERCEGFEEFRATVEKYTPETVAAITGVPAEDLHRAAEILARNKPMAVIWAMGITQHTSGVLNVLSLANLQMLLGNMGVPGGGVNPLRGQNNVQGACDMGALPNVFPGYQAVTDAAVAAKFDAAWALEPRAGRPGGTPHPRAFRQARPDRDGDGRGVRRRRPPRALRPGRGPGDDRAGRQPRPGVPGGGRVPRAPGDLPVGDGRVRRRAAARRVVRGEVGDVHEHRAARPAGPPGDRPAGRGPAGLGDHGRAGAAGAGARGPHARRAACRLGLPRPGADPGRGRRRSRRRMPASATRGWSAATGCSGRCRTPSHPGTPILHVGRFPRGQGKFHAIDHLPAAELPDAEYPLVLTTGRVLYHWHGGEMSRRARGLLEAYPEALVEISPEDAAKIGLNGHQAVRVRSRRGEMVARAVVTDRVAPGVVFGNFHFPGPGNVNNLTIGALDPVAKIPEYKVCAVAIEAVAQG